jgi:hypothetical protein
MRAFDRFLGCEVNLPNVITPGRYRLKQPAHLNTEIMIDAGELIFSDGRELFDVGGFQGRFHKVGLTDKDLAKRDLIIPALTTLAQMIRDGREKGLSPLIPATTGELATLADLEKKLGDLMKHLREIDRSPRFSMHYEANVSPLSRAKRVAPAALTYLAAHSEDWHRRTISNVLPKRILALFSEDDWATYENKVYARLLDRLEVYLRRRLAELTELKGTYSEALNLGNSTHLDHRLRGSLCQLWGDAISVEETGELLKATDASLAEVDKLRKQVGGLRQGELYRRVPRGASVSEQLRDTNILQHDPHYRHLRTLWLLYQKRSSMLRSTPAEIYDLNKRLFEDYVVYVGMVLRLALRSFRLVTIAREGSQTETEFLFGEEKGTLERVETEWILRFHGASLSIVPILFFDQDVIPRGTLSTRSVPVFLFPAGQVEGQEKFLQDSAFILNPAEFYSLERIRSLIEPFLWRPSLDSYAKPLFKLPESAVQWLASNRVGNSSGQHWSISTPVLNNAQECIRAWLPSAPVNEKTRFEIKKRVSALQLLSTCRCCGQNSIFQARQDGFIARCEGCNLEWGIYSHEGKRKSRFGVPGVHSPTLETHGAWCWDMDL